MNVLMSNSMKCFDYKTVVVRMHVEANRTELLIRAQTNKQIQSLESFHLSNRK